MSIEMMVASIPADRLHRVAYAVPGRLIPPFLEVEVALRMNNQIAQEKGLTTPAVPKPDSETVIRRKQEDTVARLAVWDAISPTGPATDINAIMAATGLSRSVADRILTMLFKAGQIERSGFRSIHNTVTYKRTQPK